jgi:protein-S-isoprenylcysteine O-methyltransferase Ste14
VGDLYHDPGRLERAHPPADHDYREDWPLPRFTRNPIYLGMVLGLIGLAIAFNSLWLLMTLVPFALVIRYGVITREEAYLERKFGDGYRRYRARVRRWL